MMASHKLPGPFPLVSLPVWKRAQRIGEPRFLFLFLWLRIDLWYRYRHIWPFEHARVRLHRKRGTADDDDDYVNASYVQPLGTTKRYIATQGPLPATFTDFWTSVASTSIQVQLILTAYLQTLLGTKRTRHRHAHPRSRRRDRQMRLVLDRLQLRPPQTPARLHHPRGRTRTSTEHIRRVLRPRPRLAPPRAEALTQGGDDQTGV